MSNQKIKTTVENLCIKVWSLAGISLSIEQAVFYDNTFSNESYSGAMNLLTNELNTLEDELRSLLEDLKNNK